jgi:hypothetical protein
LLADEAEEDVEDELDVELAPVLELEEEQAVRASTDTPASPAIRRIVERRWVRITGPSVNGYCTRGLSGSSHGGEPAVTV